jgi:hypothetical protein
VVERAVVEVVEGAMFVRWEAACGRQLAGRSVEYYFEGGNGRLEFVVEASSFCF